MYVVGQEGVAVHPHNKTFTGTRVETGSGHLGHPGRMGHFCEGQPGQT